MDLSPEEEKIAQEAKRWIRRNRNKQILFDTFLDSERYPINQDPALSIYTAGSPGAGKTEFCRSLVSKPLQVDIPHVDPDAVRNQFEGYNGGNAHLFQQAVSIAIDDIHRMALKHGQHLLLDGTFANFQRARENVNNSLNAGRQVIIFLLFLNPEEAWQATKDRETAEGRRIRKQDFIEAFFSAKDNVQKLKNQHGEDVDLMVLERRTISEKTFKYHENVVQIDDVLKFNYSREELKDLLI